MDNYTFSDPKSPVFQIKEKELRSVVRKAKALKDPEAHGIDDIEWDFEEGYICFMLPGGFALYLSTEADMEMNEANEASKALNTRASNKMNESSKSELLKSVSYTHLVMQNAFVSDIGAVDYGDDKQNELVTYPVTFTYSEFLPLTDKTLDPKVRVFR